MQRAMASALFRPLTDDWNMQGQWNDGRPMEQFAAEFIKPNDRLSSFDRLEIYNRQYWFRILDCLYDDYPGLLAVVGEEQFLKLATAYLTKYQSDSYTLRNLGDRLEKFLREEPQWTEPNQALALDMVRFEWAQVVAFDGPSKPMVTPDDLIDTPPEQMRLGLQPYLSILKLDYPVDDFLVAVKKDADSLRGEASNAINSAPTSKGESSQIPLPKPDVTYLAVHRFDNMLYFKRLEPEGYLILEALIAGSTLENACVKAVEQSTRANADWQALIKEWFAEINQLFPSKFVHIGADETFELDGQTIPNPLRAFALPVAIVDQVQGDPVVYSKPAGYQTVRYPLSGLVGTQQHGQKSATESARPGSLAITNERRRPQPCEE